MLRNFKRAYLYFREGLGSNLPGYEPLLDERSDAVYASVCQLISIGYFQGG